MINRPQHDNSASHAPTLHCNPNDERNETANHFQDTHKMQTRLSHLFLSRLFRSFFPQPVTVPTILNMKERFKNFIGGLEKTLESCKRHWKEIVTAIALPFIFEENANGLGFLVFNVSSINGGERVIIKHIEGATEGHDSKDARYLESPNPLHIYSHNYYSGLDYMLDARPADSTTTYDLHLKNIGFSGAADNFLRFLFNDHQTPIEFSWKNIFLGDTNDSNDIVADIKYLINNGGVDPFYGFPCGDFPLPDIDGSKTGVYDKRKVFFFNHTDFNRDRQTNGLDFEIFRENFNRNNETDPNTFGSYVGSDVNDFNAYADIDRNGGVGLEDLEIFKTYFKFPGDLNLDGKVDNTDYAYLANDWNVGDANFYDLEAFAGDYLRDINEPGTWQR